MTRQILAAAMMSWAAMAGSGFGAERTRAPQTVSESARNIPLAFDVDVIVVGGSTRAVAAAQAAAEAGATVFLAAPRPYLGEDICGTYRLWLDPGETPESKLGKSVFTAGRGARPANMQPGLPFTYTASQPSVARHKDTTPPSLMRDGKYQDAPTESVEFADQVSFTLDLGKATKVDDVELLAYQRSDDFVVGSVALFASDDKAVWREIGKTQNQLLSANAEGDALPFAIAVGASARYFRVDVAKAEDGKRLLLAEIVVHGPAVKVAAEVPAKAARVSVTPMTVKRALDNALLEAKVDFLYGSYATDVLRDAKGGLAGIVMANRSGRQAVRGKVIIDATDRAVVAELAGAEFAPFPAGNQHFSRIVVGGQPKADAVDTGVAYSVGGSSKTPYIAYEYSFDLPMNDGSWASYARADQEARNRTWQPGQVSAAEMLYHVPPDPVRSRAPQAGGWVGAGQLNLDALRPKNGEPVYVLSARADISRDAAAALLRPLAGMELGARVGAAAAAEAKARTIGAIETLAVAGDRGAATVTAVVGEMLNGLRSTTEIGVVPMVNSPDRTIPVIGRYDTVVIGGGTGGASAGIGAARGGAKTLVVEYLYGLGGVGTIGRISKYYHGNKVGFTSEIDKGVEDMSEDKRSNKGWNIESKMEWLRSEITKAGGDIWFLSLGAGSVVQDKRFIGVVLVTPQGRGVVICNTIIDATGNSVIPACAGLETQAITGEHISVQGTGLPSYTPGESYENSDWTFVDDDDVLDMWRIHVVAKSKYANAFDLGQLIDTRARRRIVGDVTISPMDIINNRVYPDVITVSKSNFDNHGFSSHSLFMVTPPDKNGLVGNVPYRALLPKGYDGILVTGLGISAHGDAMPVMRMQPDVQNQGYAAGRASAIAAEEATTVRGIDVKVLQKHLVEVGIIPEEMLNAKDSYPIGPEKLTTAVQAVGKNYSGIATVLSEPKEALPLLQAAWRKADDETEKLRYAHVLGMMHDATGVETLMSAVSAAKWDQGWNFRGMGQFGATTSPLDNLIIALGRTSDKRALPVIIEKLNALTITSEFSHCRAVAMALERYKDPAAAAALARLLQEPGVSGHAFEEVQTAIKGEPASPTDNSTRNQSLRELLLARALYRCGDKDGLGEKILRSYASDLRGHYATHARAILRETL